MNRLLLLVALCACAEAPLRALPAAHVRDLQGNEVVLAELRGPALVDVFATWCVPCAHAYPTYAKLAGKIRVVAISIDDDDGPVRAFVDEKRPPFEILRDPGGVVADELGMHQMPTSFLLDAQGRVVARYEGFTDADASRIESDVARLVGR